jgi:hypothetical protein
MPTLTRRREPNVHQETWHVYYDDIRIGSIAERAGVPVDVDQWGWNCGFYPGMEPGTHRRGTAATFEEARAGFEEAWHDILPTLSEAAFDDIRYHTASTAWKYAMWDAGCKMPTQTRDDRSKCFCGAEITNKSIEAHIRAAHMEKR